MVATILQLAGSILLVLYISSRSDVSIKKSTNSKINVAGEKDEKILDLIYETQIGRVGILFLIFGYLVQIINLKNLVFDESNLVYRISFTLIITPALVYIGRLIAKKIARKKYDKLPGFNPETDVTVGSTWFEENT